MLERDPTLTFFNGRFVPAHSIASPAPPPPPMPPPLYVLYQTPHPPPHPPVPSPPPPWYAHAETCFPISTAAENELDVADGLERAVCVYVRAIANERVRASKCFGSISPSPPPPPPVSRAGLAALKTALLQRQVRRGGSSGATAAASVGNTDEYALESETQLASQLSFLDALAESNPQLGSALKNIRATVHAAAGRRLWQRTDDAPSHSLVDNILQTAAFGTAPIVGVTAAECESLCAAIDNATVGACKAIAFARADGANPRDLTLRQCILLRDLGGCSAATFAGAVFSRRDTDSCSTPTAYDNPLCVQLSPDRSDLRVLDYASAEQSCRQGRGRPAVAWPKTVLEVRAAFQTLHLLPHTCIPTRNVRNTIRLNNNACELSGNGAFNVSGNELLPVESVVPNRALAYAQQWNTTGKTPLLLRQITLQQTFKSGFTKGWAEVLGPVDLNGNQNNSILWIFEREVEPVLLRTRTFNVTVLANGLKPGKTALDQLKEPCGHKRLSLPLAATERAFPGDKLRDADPCWHLAHRAKHFHLRVRADDVLAPPGRVQDSWTRIERVIVTL